MEETMSIKYIFIQLNPNLEISEFHEKKRGFNELSHKLDIYENEEKKQLLLVVIDEEMEKIKTEIKQEIVPKNEYPKMVFDVGLDIVSQFIHK